MRKNKSERQKENYDAKRDRKLNSHRFKAPRDVSAQRSASYAREVKEHDAKSVKIEKMKRYCR
jgi:hypothetical protein